MPAEIFADGDQDYIEKFNTVAQQAFDGDAAAGRLDDHIDGTADKHGASAIVNTPAGSIAATDVQAAINELDTEKQPVDATLTALAGVTTAADKLIYATGSDTFSTTDLTSAGRALLDDADASAQRTTLGLGTAATLASDTDTTLAANSDTRLATQKAVKAYVDALIAASDAVVFKGVTDCSANPNYPAADAGHLYIVSVAGKIGGASGVVVEAGDMFICKVDSTASGNQATVGANWGVIQTNINGALTTADLGVTVAALAGAAFTGLSSVTVNSATAALTLSNAGAGAALTADKQIVSTLATGTSPFAVASTTVVTNLNAQFLSGATFAAPGAIGGTTPAAAAFTTISATGQITSTLATGTAPFSVASTTNVANLNASSLNGATFAAPGTIGGGTPGAATFTTLTATGQVSLGGAAGAEGLRVTTTASAVNFLNVYGAVTAGFPGICFNGADANVNGGILTKGTGGIGLYTNSGSQLQALFSHTASAVNYATITGGATGVSPAYTVAGSDTNVGFNVSTKGSGLFRVFSNGYTAEQFRVVAVASAVNFLTVQGGVTGNGAIAYIAGADTNAGLSLSSKGSGPVGIYTNTIGSPVAAFAHTASAVNYFIVYSGATGSGPTLHAEGVDANVNQNYSLKGAGTHVFYTGSTSVIQFSVSHTASAVNRLDITGSATGNAIAISTVGSDANRSITFTTAGTGTVRFSNKIYPGTPAAATQTAAGISGGTGAPSNADASDGDFYFRSDGGALTSIYQKRAGAWVGIV